MIKKVRFSSGVKFSVKIYDESEHNIKNSDIDTDAILAIKKIRELGGEGYIVGGAIRDLILGKRPKDFDIATSLLPSVIRKKFSNARIIGKRFKLVLLMYKNMKAIEVTTFRGLDSSEYENEQYGTMETDAQRRDFTVNALYYDPIGRKLYDFHDSFSHLKSHKLRSIINISTTFTQDPVRMLRAVKYSVKDDLKMDRKLKKQILRDSNLIKDVSKSRMAEEINKILLSSCSFEIFSSLNKFGLLKYIIPPLDEKISKKDKELKSNLQIFDNRVTRGEFKKDLIVPYFIYYTLNGKFNKYKGLKLPEYRLIANKETKAVIEPILKDIKKDFDYLNFSNAVYYSALKLLSKG